MFFEHHVAGRDQSFETATEIFGIMVSLLRLRTRLFFSGLSLNTETETFLVQSQCWDWDFFLCGLNVETEIKTHFWLVSVSRLPNVKTETKIKYGHTNFIWLETTKKVTEIDLTNKVKLINNKQELIWTPLLKLTEVARLKQIEVVETETLWDYEVSG